MNWSTLKPKMQLSVLLEVANKYKTNDINVIVSKLKNEINGNKETNKGAS